MSNLHELAQRLMALDDKITACMKCGMCQAVCPMFGASGMEADVARGKLALIDNLAHEMIQDPAAVSDKLGRCLLCGSCQASCPPGVKIMDVFMEAREIVNAYLGMHPVKKMIFRVVLPQPGVFNLAMRVGAPVQGLVFRSTGSAQGTVCAPMLNFMLGDRHMRPLAKKPLHARYGTLDESRPAGGIKVAFYPGCMGDKIFTNVSEACLKVFDYHEVGVYLPTNYSCCGIPALSSGDLEGFEKMVMHNVDVLKEGSFDLIVTPCSSCTETIRSLWPKMAGKMPYKYRDAINELSQKAMDINAFLVDVLKVKPRASGRHGQTKVTYHESCHLLRSLGVSAQPRELIRMNPDYDLVEMKEADRCCGCGGSFTLSHYDLSRKIGQRKRDNIVASGAEVVATGCPACMMQLSDMLAHNGDSVTVKHTIEIYADSLK